MENQPSYNVGEICKALSISRGTLVRLCNSGLIPEVRRDRRYRRIFQDWHLDHIRTLLGLRAARLTKSELKRYVRLVRQGRQTLPEQKAMFETRKRQLWLELESIQRSIDFLERQVEVIDQEIS